MPADEEGQPVQVDWRPQLGVDPHDLSREERVRTAVFQAIGAGSMCWENVEAAGVFDSDLALSIGNGLMQFLRDEGVVG